MASSSAITNEALLEKVKHVQGLLSHFTQSLASPLPITGTALPSPDAPHPLKALRDAAKLLHAHATKIGLLLINDPFTPSAIYKELSSCEGQCLPGMMASVEICHPQIWTTTVAKEVRLRVDAALSALSALLLDVQKKTEGGIVKVDTTRQKEKTLASTGQVWQACDVLVALEKQGIAGCVTKKAQEYRDMLKDALEELKEWGEDEDDQDEGFVGSDEDNDKDSMEEIFSGSRLPAHRKDLKELLEDGLKKLKLVDMLFQALAKRRVKTLKLDEPPISSVDLGKVQRAGALASNLRALSEGVDEFANALYELDAEQARTQLTGVLDRAQGTANAMDKSWERSDDEFTAWSKKWLDAVKTARSGSKMS